MLDETAARERMDEAAVALVARVEEVLPGWVEAHVARLVAAWGGLGPEATAATRDEAAAAGAACARRVAGELRALFAVDVEQQRATPLEVLRGAVREPTAVLAAAGVPDVVRDEFDERAWPDDRFGLVPRTMREVDEDLAAVHFAWGVAKAELIRARRTRREQSGGRVPPR